jgi:uncharacterized protein YdaT
MKTTSPIKKNTLSSYRSGYSKNINQPEKKDYQKSIKETQKSVRKQNIDISDKAKDLASKASEAAKATPLAAQAATSVASNLATSALSAALSSDGKKEDVKDIAVKTTDKKDSSKVSQLLKSKKGTLKRPGIFFITGMDSFSLSTDYDGLKNMAEAIPGARVYEWDQQDEIVEEVKKRKLEMPIILVGHSFGADTAVEVSNKLNSLEHGFRRVDLLVTIDAAGSNNDIIPQNVGKNLNVFGENSGWLNDGPNVARNIQRTTVLNELRQEDHTDLDDSKDIQFSIMDSIQNVLKKAESSKK